MPLLLPLSFIPEPRGKVRISFEELSSRCPESSTASDLTLAKLHTLKPTCLRSSASTPESFLGPSVELEGECQRFWMAVPTHMDKTECGEWWQCGGHGACIKCSLGMRHDLGESSGQGLVGVEQGSVGCKVRATAMARRWLGFL